MSYLNVVKNIFVELQKQVNHRSLKEKYFSCKDTSFTRRRSMPLSELVAFLLQRSTNGLDIKLDKWFSKWMPEGTSPVSRQAISKARQLLPEEIFHDFLRLSARTFVDNSGLKKEWNGYQVYAIDGTDLQLPTTDETLKDFGCIKSHFNTRMAGASASLLYDVLNDVILDGIIAPYKTSERSMAERLLEDSITEKMKKNSIIVFDRGYPSYEFLGFLFNNNIKFVIRVKEQMSRLRSNTEDGEVYRKCRNKCRTIRTIQVELENGTKEYLISNISPEEISHEQFSELYFLRWGIEGKYKEIKSCFEIENFSGKKSICIKQDFYINLFLTNICSLIKQEIDEELQNDEQATKPYQTRKSFLIYRVNSIISGLVLKKIGIVEEITNLIECCKKKRSQIRPNRKCERNLNLNRRKYSINYKCCI